MHNLAKIIDIIDTSEVSVEDAIETAIARAAMSVNHLRWFQVTEVRGAIKDQQIDRHQIMLKVGFALDEGDAS